MNNPRAGSNDWRMEHDGLVLHERLHTSFQRCARPQSGYFEKSPTSLGMLPLAPDMTGALFLPMAEDEALWVGLSAVPAKSAVAVSVAVKTHAHGTLDPVAGRPWADLNYTLTIVRELSVIHGFLRDEHSVWPFQSGPAAGNVPSCEAFIFRLASLNGTGAGAELSCPTEIQVVSYGEYRARTGCPPPSPLDPDSGYRGWRLP